MTNRFEDLTGFEFSNVYVRTRNIIGFAAQRWPNTDPLEQRETAIFFYYPDDPPETKWAVRYLGQTVGVHGCAAFSPNERWVFVAGDGEVYVVGQGDDEWEGAISPRPNLYFSNAKSVRKGHAIAVGPNRKVFLRRLANDWIQLEDGLFPDRDQSDLEFAGFRDIDGFSETDMYACGGRGDLWHFDRSTWRQIAIPTNANLKNICCAEDGLVYITTAQRDILRGRNATWDVIGQDETSDTFESLVCYNKKVYISTVSEIFVIDGGEFKPANLGVPQMKSKAHLASGDGILVVAGSDQAALYDGQKWDKFLE